jgi:hypothetical protein
MPAPKPRINREDFDALVRASGLTLNEEQTSELHAAYGYIEAMSARVRTSGERSRSAEPAIIFNPRVT